MLYAHLDCLTLDYYKFIIYKLKGNVLKSPGYNERMSMVYLGEAGGVSSEGTGSISSGGSWTIADHERHYLAYYLIENWRFSGVAHIVEQINSLICTITGHTTTDIMISYTLPFRNKKKGICLYKFIDFQFMFDKLFKTLCHPMQDRLFPPNRGKSYGHLLHACII